MIAGRQGPQGQEELGNDDQDSQRPVEGDRPRHESQADLDRDEGDRDRAAPFEHERRLERGPQDLHRRVAVAAADVADRVDLLGAPTEQLERREPLEHVEEEGAQPAELDEATLGDHARPPTDEGEEQDQDRPGQQEDEDGRRIDRADGDQHEERHRDGEDPGGLEDRHPGVERLGPVDDDGRQLAASFATGVDRPEREQVPGQVGTEPPLESIGCPLCELVANDQQRGAHDREGHDRRQQARDRRKGRALQEHVGHDDAGQVGRPDDQHRGREPAPDPEGEQGPRAGRACQQAALGRDRAAARARPCGRSALVAVRVDDGLAPEEASRRRPYRAARTASR